MTLYIASDLHVGAVRTGGTTPTSAYALRQYLLQGLAQLLDEAGNRDVMILGDLFDTQAISLADLMKAYQIILRWKLAHPEARLILVAGNHDLSKNSATLSSFQFLCGLLQEQDRVVTVFEPTMTPYGYVIPHLPNQDLFDLALANVPPCKVLFLHCNYANEFAQHSDHSLNISKEQAEAAPVERIVIAHEHNARRMLGSKVWIPGNQLASSISDCMEEKNKHVTLVELDGSVVFADWPRPDYVERGWRELAGSTEAFIRVVGDAEAHEAADVVAAISRLRQTAPAFVITNAVDIKSDDATEEFAASLEEVRSFDVLDALKKLLTPEEVAIIESLK